MPTENVTTRTGEPIDLSNLNLPPSTEKSDDKGSESKSADRARSIRPDRGTEGNSPRKFAPGSPSDPIIITETSHITVEDVNSIKEGGGSAVLSPANIGPSDLGKGALNNHPLIKGRPVGDQTNMPAGVVPRNRMLTETELSENPLNTFLQDPSSFAASYFINTMRNFVMPGRTVPPARPGETVNGSDNIVGFTMSRINGHNAQMTVTGVPSELARPGTPSSSLAYYLPFTNGGATTIRVPRNPAADDPQFVITGPFTGCSFYVREDPTDPNFLLFTHDPRRGAGTTTSPTGIPEGAVGMSYDNTYGQEDGMLPTQVPSASAFAFYDRATRRWVISVQHAVAEVTLGPSGVPGQLEQRQRTPGRIEGAFIPVIFGTDHLPPTPVDPNLPGPSNRNGSGEGMSFWTAFEAGGASGGVIGGAAGLETGPGAIVSAGVGAIIGATVAGTAWLFDWVQHHDSRP